MAIPPQTVAALDLTFFRTTGLVLVFATLLAGAVMLSLTLRERHTLLLAQTQESAHASEAADIIQFASREGQMPLSSLPFEGQEEPDLTPAQ